MGTTMAPGFDPMDFHLVAIKDGPQALIQVAGQILRRGVAVFEGGQFIQIFMVDFFQHLL